MAKIDLQELGSLTNEQAAIVLINENSADIEILSDTFLSRDGTTPNTMEADLDMNGNQILNLPEPVGLTEPLRVQELQDFTGGSLSLTVQVPPDGDKGDVIVTSSGATWTIDADAVTYAKMQDISSSDRLLGRGSGLGTGNVQEITLGTGLTMSGIVLNAELEAQGLTGALQYSASGSMAGASGTTWDNTNRSLSIVSTTLTTNAPILDLSQTWNSGASTFQAVKVNVTNTASSSSSKLLDLQIAGTSRFGVSPAGNLTITAGTVTAQAPIIDLTQTWNNGAVTFSGLKMNITNTSSAQASLYADFQLGGTSQVQIRRDNGEGGGQPGIFMKGDVNFYGVYALGTSAILGGPGAIKVAAKDIDNGLAGTPAALIVGAAMAIGWSSVSAATNSSDTAMKRTGAGIIGIVGSSAGGSLELLEMTAPAALANTGRIYTEDNGGGKTRLMVQFGTGAAQQIAIEP